jgi:hypothetical protein
MDKNETILFNTICKKCQEKKKYSETHVHIDWEKRKWFYICLDPECGAMEAFDEKGELIMLKEKDKNSKEEVN